MSKSQPKTGTNQDYRLKVSQLVNRDFRLDVPHLEQNLGTHAEETINYPEGKDHGHTVYEPKKYGCQ